jgi:hypothetical protein
MKIAFWLITFLTLFLSCKTYKPEYTYQESRIEPVDYSNIKFWAAHPDKTDESDRTPEGDTVTYDHLTADVFFIHPTTYTGDKGQEMWNGALEDQKLNIKTDEGTIRFQASAFNHAGRVFAPRYRQAHLHAYFTKDKASAKKAFNLAYEDVKQAFDYYLHHLNNGRPIIIAGHSQGTNHAERLLEEYFTGKPLKEKLVAAYLIGMPVRKNRFTDIFPCKDSSETGCFVSWRTFKKGYKLPAAISENNVCVTNPISWACDENYAPKTSNRGTLLFDFNKIYTHHIDAQVSHNILWANKPKFFGSIFLRTKNYHPADINFYYFNIRENANLRVNIYSFQKNIKNY